MKSFIINSEILTQLPENTLYPDSLTNNPNLFIICMDITTIHIQHNFVPSNATLCNEHLNTGKKEPYPNGQGS